MSSNHPFLTIPGLASSGPGHWQTRWEELYPHHFSRIEQQSWDLPDREEWIEAMQQRVRVLSHPVILVAHSMGCITVAHWAARYASPWVKGALLVAPADVEQSKRLNFVRGFCPIPQQPLPFPSLVVASTNDRYATLDRAALWAEKWGSKFVNIGALGHINVQSDLGDWPEGLNFLKQVSTGWTGVNSGLEPQITLPGW